jgi:hypothetical protein
MQSKEKIFTFKHTIHRRLTSNRTIATHSSKKRRISFISFRSFIRNFTINRQVTPTRGENSKASFISFRSFIRNFARDNCYNN